jgi:hypothetical protein
LSIQILSETVNTILEVAPVLGSNLSYELKCRRSVLIGDVVKDFLECISDAFGEELEIERTTPRLTSIRLSKELKKKDFIEKEFKSTIYDVLRNLIGK